MSENLENWIERISNNELPIFKYTVHAINDVVSQDASSTSDLSQIILRDANLTARVLRVANSAAYNITGSQISTISRAIVYLGFNLVRDISMSLAIIDALLSGEKKEHALGLMAESFHAAVQARDFAESRGDDGAEEVFIAALLKNIGEITFWCVAGEEGAQINDLMETQDFSQKMAEQEVLDFTLEQLTVGLTRDWHLSDLLHSAINTPTLNNPRIKDIVLAIELSKTATKGWAEKETIAVANKVADHLNVEKNKIVDLLKTNAIKAAETAKLFGASSIIKFLPIEEEETNTNEVEIGFDIAYPIADPVLQLNILRDLSGMLFDKPDFNLILEIVLEGIYRGVGLDRAVFALLTADKKAIKAKYALGKDSQKFASQFHFSLQVNNVFRKLVDAKEALWVKDTQSNDVGDLVSPEIRKVLACQAFYIAPLLLSGRVIGLLYADRQPSKRDLDNESFESFKHFAYQACHAMQVINPR
ncbi:MAG: HDOD domain-containing protein [Woeseiaceae bacterium]